MPERSTVLALGCFAAEGRFTPTGVATIVLHEQTWGVLVARAALAPPFFASKSTAKTPLVILLPVEGAMHAIELDPRATERSRSRDRSELVALAVPLLAEFAQACAPLTASSFVRESPERPRQCRVQQFALSAASTTGWPLAVALSVGGSVCAQSADAREIWLQAPLLAGNLGAPVFEEGRREPCVAGFVTRVLEYPELPPTERAPNIQLAASETRLRFGIGPSAHIAARALNDLVAPSRLDTPRRARRVPSK